ncbi:hypothetical protein ccbrp13_09890 [Ktedonobacteria bacterium brp13]|nr:hypothetical protein ccbrp13_09890 [Ktedonobacteria bacterium brp13]
MVNDSLRMKVLLSFSHAPIDVDHPFASEDVNAAFYLQDWLHKRNVESWPDVNQDTIPLLEWKETVHQRMQEVVAVLCLISPETVRTRYVGQLLEVAELYPRCRIYLIWVAGQDDEWDDLVPRELKHLTLNIDEERFDIRGDIRSKPNTQRLNDLLATLRARHTEDAKKIAEDVRNSAQQRSSMQDALFLKRATPIPPIVEPIPLLKRLRVLGRTVVRSFAPFVTMRSSLSPITMHQSSTVETSVGTDVDMFVDNDHEPYKGLDPFTQDDTAFFFGREQLSDTIADRIISSSQTHAVSEGAIRFFSIIGVSGSGKSSLVMAGVIPHLQQQEKNWLCLDVVRPQESPLLQLATMLHSYFPHDSNNRLRDKLRQDPSSLLGYTETIARRKKCKLILYIDQFEELFMPAVDADTRKIFMSHLEHVASSSNGLVTVIVSLRTEFQDEFLQNCSGRIIRETLLAQMIHIAGIDRKDLRKVIEEPAKRAGISFEGDLVSELLYDIRDQRDALPLLEFTLSELYAQRDGRVLTQRAYTQLRGKNGVLNKYADRIYREVVDDAGVEIARRQKIARYLFSRLVYVNDSIDTATKRQVPKDELALSDQAGNSILAEIVNAFVNARLLVAHSSTVVYQEKDVEDVENTGKKEGDVVGRETTTIEIAHEALIREWQQLRMWLEDAAVDRPIEQKLAADSHDWASDPRKLYKKLQYYYSGRELNRALVWSDKNEVSRVQHSFLAASKLFGLCKFIVIVLLLIGSVGGLAVVQSEQTSKSLQVTSMSDSGPGSLRAAIENAPPETIIHLASKVVLTSDDLVFKKDVTVTGSGVDSAAILGDGKHSLSIMISPDVTVTLQNLEIANGYSDLNSFMTNKGDLTLNNCYIHDNETDSDGGGVANSGGILSIINTKIMGNKAARSGGGVFTDNGITTITQSNITKNTSSSGGGVYSRLGSAVISKSNIEDNVANDGDGGGISVFNGSLVFAASTVYQNKASTYGGGISVIGGESTIDSAIIQDNSAGTYGGGISVIKDTDNGKSSLMTVLNTPVSPGSNSRYSIANNRSAQVSKDATLDVLGIVLGAVQNESTVQITSEEHNYPQGSPAPKFSAVDLGPTYYKGVASINAFCQAQNYSYGAYSQPPTATFNATSDDIQIQCYDQHNQPSPTTFDAQKVCHLQYPKVSHIFDRVADFNDQTALQCYSNVHLLGPAITIANANAYCKNQSDVGVDSNTRSTAYDWRCKSASKDTLPAGFSVADMCQSIYPKSHNAFDRLTNFYSPDGWECWAPD